MESSNIIKSCMELFHTGKWSTGWVPDKCQVYIISALKFSTMQLDLVAKTTPSLDSSNNKADVILPPSVS